MRSLPPQDIEGEVLEAKTRIQALDREINGIEGRSNRKGRHEGVAVVDQRDQRHMHHVYCWCTAGVTWCV